MLQPKDRMAEWIQKQTHIYAVNKRLTSDLKTQTESEGGKRYSMQMEFKRKPE